MNENLQLLQECVFLCVRDRERERFTLHQKSVFLDHGRMKFPE